MARRTDGLTDPDLVPDLPSHPVTRPGDLWILGTHRLVCGDGTAPEDAAPLLAGVRPHLMVTDPPYGVNRDTDALTLASIARELNQGGIRSAAAVNGTGRLERTNRLA